MNKKALLQHWIVIGIILAIGVFLIATKGFTVAQESVGVWHLDFVANTLQQAEVNLLENDQIARNEAFDVILKLAENGGFNGDSDCGGKFWNKGEKWCLKNVRDLASSMVDSKIVQNEIVFIGEIMSGKGEMKEIIVKNGVYSYSTDISINLGYAFDDYARLEQEARNLVRKCSGNLESCVNENLPFGWEKCGGNFCVKSYKNYVIKGIPVIYEFGLSFV